MEKRFEARTAGLQILINGSMWLETALAGAQLGAGIALGDMYSVLSRTSVLMLLVVFVSLGQRLVSLLAELHMTQTALLAKYRLRGHREMRWAAIHRVTVRSGSIHFKGDGMRGILLHAWQFESGLWERVHHRILKSLETLQFEERDVFGRRRVYVVGPLTRSQLPEA